MRYQILVSRGHGEIANHVNVLINDGWVPVGGVAIEKNSEKFPEYFQAMVHNDLPPLEQACYDKSTC